MVGLMAPASKYALALAALLIAILTVLMLVMVSTFHSRHERAFVANGFICMRNERSYSAPAALLFWLLARRGAMLYPKLIGGAAGGLTGLIGLSVLELTCSNLDVVHILAWQRSVVMISAAAGVLFGTAVEYSE